jgi:hypothetical protein
MLRAHSAAVAARRQQKKCPTPCSVGPIGEVDMSTPTATNQSVSQHTPGPWHVEAAPSNSSMRSIRNEDGKAIAFVNRGPHEAANVALIENAPEVLELLRHFAGPCVGGCNAVERAVALIAKSEGRKA